MGIRIYRPMTPGTRTRTVSAFSEVTKSEPEKSLTHSRHRPKGRNNRGVITCRHRGGGHKRLYRVIDFKRDKHNIPAKVVAISTIPTAMRGLRCFFTGMARSAILFIQQIWWSVPSSNRVLILLLKLATRCRLVTCR